MTTNTTLPDEGSIAMLAHDCGIEIGTKVSHEAMEKFVAALLSRYAQPEPQYTAEDMASQGAQQWREGYAAACGEAPDVPVKFPSDEEIIKAAFGDKVQVAAAGTPRFADVARKRKGDAWQAPEKRK